MSLHHNKGKERAGGRSKKPAKPASVASPILPICAECKRIRNAANQWEQLEAYLLAHFDIHFTHTLCPSHVAEAVRGLMDHAEARKLI